MRAGIEYAVRSLPQILVTALVVFLLVFVLLRVTGDPVASMLPQEATVEERQALAHKLGYDRPLYVQFADYAIGALHGDFGRSLAYQQPAMPLIAERLPASLELAGAALVLGLVIALPLGILSALYRGRLLDLFISGVTVLGRAMPSFWLAMLLILLFAVTLRLLPITGFGSWTNLVLPATTLALPLAAQMTKVIRANLLEILTQEHVRAARARGIPEPMVILRHGVRNALIPVVTVLGLHIPELIGGVVIVETVFAYPGLGQLTVNAINSRDMPIAQAAVLLFSFLVMITNVSTDVVYGLLDPRVAVQGQRA